MANILIEKAKESGAISSKIDLEQALKELKSTPKKIEMSSESIKK